MPPIDVPFPLGGVARTFEHEKQPPVTTVDALNVRPYDTLKRRGRGGSRPGLVKAYQEQLGSGNPVRMLAHLRTARSDGTRTWRDWFINQVSGNNTTLVGNWTASSFSDGLPDYHVTQDRAGYINATAAVAKRAATITTLPAFDGTSDFTINIRWKCPTLGSGSDNTFWRLYLHLTDSSLTNWYDAGGIMIQGTVTWQQNQSIRVYGYTDAGVETYDSGSLGLGVEDENPLLTVKWTAGASVLDVDLNGTSHLASKAFTGGDALGSVGTDIAFEVETGSELSSSMYINTFEMQYARNEDSRERRSFVIAGSNGLLYRDFDAGQLAQISAGDSRTISTDHRTYAVDHLQKLYIADYGIKHIGTDGVLATTTTFTSAYVNDFTSPDQGDAVVAVDDAVVFEDTGNGGNATLGAHRISSIATTTITFQAAAGSSTDTGINFRIERTPKVYDPVDDTLDEWVATTGTMPVGCPLIARYLDRIVLAGQLDFPHIWYMSRAGDANDWDYTQLDRAAAIASTNSEAGSLGEPITALMPHSDDYLLFGCTSSIWVLTGDPRVGGELDNVDHTIGVVSGGAWCHGPDRATIFLSPFGLYMLPARAVADPVPLSLGPLPNDLRDIDPTTHEVCIAYDPVELGIHIWLTQIDGGGSIHWWYDWRQKGFWPVRTSANYEPFSILRYEGNVPNEQSVFLGGRDGYVREPLFEAETDDGTDISSNVWIGPLVLNKRRNLEGMIDRLRAALGKGSGDVTAEIYVGATAEDALDSTALLSFTLSEGANSTWRPRLRGHVAYIKLSNVDNTPWALEGMTVGIQPLEKW